MTDFLDEYPITQRLILRQAIEADAEDLYKEFSNPNVTRYLDWGGPTSLEQAIECIDDWTKEYSKRNFINWVVTEKGNDKLIGTVVINVRGRDHRYGLFTHKITEVISLGYNLCEHDGD